MTTLDVLIVGAGPAGSALALRLARAGWTVRILERYRFPRDKACGDSLNPGALVELESLGLLERLAGRLGPERIDRWLIEAPDGSRLEVGFGSGGDGEKRCGWAVRRRDLDAALLDEAADAGARVSFGFRVFDVVRQEGRVVGVIGREGTTEQELRAKLVVGADGLRSVIQRRLGLAKGRGRLRKIAVVGHLARGNGAGGRGELRVRDGRTCGYAPCPGGANLTLVVPQGEGPELAAGPRAFLLRTLESYPEVRERVDADGLEEDLLVTGPFDRPVRRPWYPGAVLVGDAAGYYDPFTGQGIHQALLSARLAAEAAVAAVTDRDSESRAWRRYARSLALELRPRRSVQRIIEEVISRPRLMSRFVGALAADDAAIGARLLRVTGDLDHPITLLSPVLWTRLLYLLVKGDR